MSVLYFILLNVIFIFWMNWSSNDSPRLKDGKKIQVAYDFKSSLVFIVTFFFTMYLTNTIGIFKLPGLKEVTIVLGFFIGLTMSFFIQVAKLNNKHNIKSNYIRGAFFILLAIILGAFSFALS